MALIHFTLLPLPTEPRAQWLLSEETKSELLSRLTPYPSPPRPSLTPVLSSIPRGFFPVVFGFLGSTFNIPFLSTVSRSWAWQWYLGWGSTWS